jgi:cytochrome b involved in lipid metabolism
MINKIIKKVILINLIIVPSVVLFLFIRSNQVPNKLIKPISKTSENTVEIKTEEVTPASTQPTQSTAVTSPATTVVTDSRCIVTVNGNKYDVSSYKNKHPGGDIFVCGTDMTSAFNNQHSSSTLKKMAQYLVN